MDSVAAAVILESFFSDPGAAVLVKPWRPQHAGAAPSCWEWPAARDRHAMPVMPCMVCPLQAPPRSMDPSMWSSPSSSESGGNRGSGKQQQQHNIGNASVQNRSSSPCLYHCSGLKSEAVMLPLHHHLDQHSFSCSHLKRQAVITAVVGLKSEVQKSQSTKR